MKQKNKISAREIETKFQVSYDTARRDLRILEEQGLLKRTHGGAILLNNPEDDPRKKSSTYSKNADINKHIEAIALKAASVIEDKEVIFINDPVFSEVFINNVRKDITLTVVTNSIIVAEQFRNFSNIQLFLRGGEIDDSGICMDIFSVDIIRKMRFDKSFITSTSISSKFGLSMQTNHSINFLNAIIESSKESIGLYPSDRVGYESILSICPANKLDVLITNHDAPPAEIENLNKQGVKIIIADDTCEE